ncbi:uncharacterized protein LOC115227648, partial [Octopus sinensis]|uniref:Uncharacterized protein LOC115227648 n=1 Tax=Octopus sinensis TaxID=2607531 RepID=A0A6P7TWG4_9MOLL
RRSRRSLPRSTRGSGPRALLRPPAAPGSRRSAALPARPRPLLRTPA